MRLPCLRLPRLPHPILLGLSLLVMSWFASYDTASANTYAVTKTTDTADGSCDLADCSLREAVIAANANAGADAIDLQTSQTYTLSLGSADSAVGTVTEASGDLDITGAVTLNGNGSTVNANSIDRAIAIGMATPSASFDVVINDLTITGGLAQGSASHGGGISVRGAKLTLNRCVVTGNSTNDGASIDNGGGIALIYNSSPSIQPQFYLNDTTVSNNTGGNGGGVYSENAIIIFQRSTLSGNISKSSGGGGFYAVGGTFNNVQLLNCTISGNSTTGNGGGFQSTNGTYLFSNTTVTQNTATGNGGGIYKPFGTFTLKNNIIVGNTGASGSDCVGTFTSSGGNVFGSSGGCTAGGSDTTATSASSVLNTTLANNGGLTKTHRLITGSPALDFGSGCEATDQRGVTRPIDGNGDSSAICDAGSYEFDPVNPTVSSIVRDDASPTQATTVHFTVTFNESVTGVDTGDFTVTTASGTATGTVASVSTDSGISRTITVSSITGQGDLRLDVVDNDTIIGPTYNPLGGPGTGNGSFTSGEVYTIDRTAPTVLSITRLDPSPTRDSFVRYNVVFSEPVSGVADDDFTLTKTGTLTGEAVSGVSGNGGGDTYTVGVDTGTGGGGNGTLRLNLADDDSITDAAGNMLGGTGAGNGNFTAGETYVIPPVIQSGQVLISEFRARGPQGESDEYVELYNNTDTNITVLSTDNSSGWSLAASDGAIRATLPNGFVFPARSHYLVANGNGYSLGSVAPEDDDFFTDLPTSNLGLALFSTSNAGNFSLSNRLDAVGYDDEPSGLYREGNGFSTGNAEMTQDLEYAFVRNLASGNPADTDNNLTDFLPVETSLSGATALGEKLGSPGPEDQSGPITHNEASTLQVGLIDTGASSSVSPNRDRDVNDPLGTNGTLSINRTLTNTSGQTLSAVRLRVVSLTTAPLVAGRADLRVKGVKVQRSFPLLPWSDPSVTLRDVDPPFDPSLGGGLNSTLTVVTDDTPMLPGDVIAISIILGVETPGSFKFAANFEALPAPPP
jgi:CSLREA domain-containing protein